MNSIYNKFLILSVMVVFSVSTIYAGTNGNDSLIAGASGKFGVPNLKTEKAFYLAGQTVVISGSGFQRYEEISLKVEQYDAQLGQEVLRGTWSVFADGKGNFETSWEIPVLGRYTITGAGSQSGQEVQTSFSCVTPVVVEGNPNCATLNSSSNPAFAYITSNYGFKLDANAPTGTYPMTNGGIRELTGGAPADPSNSVTINHINDSTFDWSATRSITAVIVKSGPRANVYPYNPAAYGDQYLVTPRGQDISHIEFCLGPAPASITIIKDAAPNSTQSFGFKATGQVNQNFSLVDNGVVGPDRKTFSNLTGFGAGNTVTITEGSSTPYSLTSISCTSNVTNNNSINVPARFVTIKLEAGEKVVCTFLNSIVTAAHVSLSGKVTDAFGNGLSRTLVTIQNLSNGETQTIYTNSFGYYRFDGLQSGDSFIVTVSHKRYAFSNNSSIFTLSDAIENLNFTADLE